MADLSGYSPIYVRSNGNDSTGDGSIGNPYLTAQKAFESSYCPGRAVYISDKIIDGGTPRIVATDEYTTLEINDLLFEDNGGGSAYKYIGGDTYSYSSYISMNAKIDYVVGDVVLDFGAGSFGGVDLNAAGASEWPSRIAVRGAGATQSFLGGINGNGADEIYDYEFGYIIESAAYGKNISIVSTNTINIGNISANGGNGTDTVGGGGLVNLQYCDSGNISNGCGVGNPGSGNDAGAVVLVNSTSGNISSYGGGQSISLTNSISDNISSYGLSGGSGGSTSCEVILVNTISGNITSNGGSGAYNGANGGNITLTNSTARNINSYGGGGSDGVGNGGIVNLSKSRCDIISNFNGNNDRDGSVNLIDGSTSNTVTTGIITIIGHCIVPNNIIANVDASQMIKGRGVNSSLLGVL
jgi:hypothetical protein